MDQYMEANKNCWNGLAKIHEKSAFYDVEGFKKGKSSLTFIELEELGDVRGKSLLHLQCHFGMDTISWARLGAKAVGVDFSETAIELARSLNSELGQEARFVCSNVYNLKESLDEKFDIVFTSYGAIGWLPDIRRWGEIAAHFLKEGGLFYMVEFHPVLWMYDDAFEKISYSYFHTKEPIEDNSQGSYADPQADFTHKSYGWNHPLGDVINALLANGLTLEFLHEFPFSTYNCFPNLVQGADGWWRLWEARDTLPMMYSLKAKK